MTPSQNRFESDPDQLVEQHPLPAGWTVGSPDPADRFDVARLTHLLRAHERHGVIDHTRLSCGSASV